MNWIQHTTSLASALFNLTSALLGRRILEVWVFALLAGVLNADRVLLAEPPSKTEPPSKKLLTVASIFDSDVYSEDSRSWTWDRHRPILWHLREQDGDPQPTLVKIEPEPWQEQLVLTPEQMTPQGRTEPLKIDSFEWSADERYLLVFTNSVRVWRAKTRGDYWLWDRHKNVWRQLGGSADAQSLMFATLSPDGKRVGYVATIDGERGLYTEDADSAEVNAIATSRDRNQIYGTFDWVYEEELGLRRGFEFSPDSRRLAFWHLDTTGVPQQTLIDNTSNRYAAIKSFAYPKVGETNAAARIGICDLANNRLTWAKIGGDPREHYLATLHWPPGHDKWLAHGTSDTQSALSSHPASNVCLVQQLNRNQTINRLLAIDAVTGATSEVLRETSRGWVSPQTRLHWMPISSGDIPDLFWLTERNGFRQLERIALSSNWNVHARQLLTPESFDVIAIEAVNQDAKRIVFVASPNDPTRRSLYQVQSDGSDLRCLTPKRDGTYQFDFDSSGTLAIETWSSRSAVPTKRCVSVNPYQVVRELVDNVELQRSLAALPPIHREFIHLPIPVDSRDQTSGEQIELDGWIMMPESARDAAAGSLPLIVYTYGEPFGQTVVDRYGGKKDLWHRMMVQHGFVV
ncbi:MAG: DPP IV N-terminal domain-containing protein, partial [Planctomycetota bacterium]